MSEKIPKATHMGELRIADFTIPCAVLEDGKRVLTQAGFLHALGPAKRSERSTTAVTGTPPFMAANNLKPFISQELQRLSIPIMFKPLKGGKRAYGYKAELLPKVCKVFWGAKEADALLPSQKHIAKQCEILLRGFATVEIIALVDEATGYQEERDKAALHRILEAYIVKELLPWTKRFPDEYYRQLFRLREWQYSPLSVKRPQLVGKLTNKIVFKKLPPGVRNELGCKNPPTRSGHGKYKHHQFLTKDVSNPHLEKHLASITTLMRVSPNWRSFERLLERAFPTKGDLLEP